MFTLYFLIFIFAFVSWIIYPIMEFEKRNLPIPAWYPFDKNNIIIYIILFIYQIIGILYAASCNIIIETFFAGLIFHLNAQILRLGYLISNFNYDIDNKQQQQNVFKTLNIQNNILLEYKNDIKILFQLDYVHNKIKDTYRKEKLQYAEIIKCIILHQVILE